MEQDRLTWEGLARLLPDRDVRVRVYETVSSTNTVVREAAENGEEEGLVVLASSQSAGRGRMGRRFFSPGGTGLYVSFLLRPQCSAPRAALLTPLAAVCVCQAIETVTGQAPAIKWVNDIFLHGRKICGILTEASTLPENGRLRYAVPGIGINVYPPAGGFPEEIQQTAGFLCPSARPGLLNALAAELIRRFSEACRRFPGDSLAEEYRKRSLVIGKEILVLSGDSVRNAVALDVEEDCRLHVRYGDGTEDLLSSGEIRIRLTEPDGYGTGIF